jgi:hypothetical protein
MDFILIMENVFDDMNDCWLEGEKGGVETPPWQLLFETNYLLLLVAKKNFFSGLPRKTAYGVLAADRS